MHHEDQMATRILIFLCEFSKSRINFNNHIMVMLNEPGRLLLLNYPLNQQRLWDSPDKPASSLRGNEISNCPLDSGSG